VRCELLIGVVLRRGVVFAAVLGAPVLAAAPGQTFSLALGLPSAELGWRRNASERLALGARLTWDQLDRDETLSLSALGIAAPVSFELALGSFILALEVAPGARRTTSRIRDASSGSIVDATPVYSLRMPFTTTLRMPLSDASRLSVFAAIAPDLILSGGLVLSPQAGVAAETDVSPAFSIGVEGRAGRVFVVSGEPAVFAGRHAVTMPLAILLTAAFRP
jgi:hypothetical protein